MYNADGAFGKVRLVSRVRDSRQDSLFTLAVVGWHRCNHLYQIRRPNGTDMPLLLYTVDGCGQLQVGKTSCKLYPGSIAVVPRNTPTAYGVPEGGDWEFYWLHVCGGAACRFLDEALDGTGFYAAADAASCYGRRFEELITLSAGHTTDTALRISQKLSSLLHLYAMDLRQSRCSTLSDRVTDYIEQHFREELVLSDIADALFVSTPHMIRVFRKETGQTPHKYLLEYRLRAAAQLLKYSDLSTAQIASSAGFSSASHFIRCFRKAHGVTPAHYRTAARQNAGVQKGDSHGS